MLPGVPVHVVQRGNNRAACFFTEQDRNFYLLHLARLLRQSQCALHAYCLMTNHVHLLLTPFHANSCAVLMKRLSQLHSQYVNRTYARTGTLWQGRFRSCLVQSETYLLSCQRYIELNPVRACMTKHPGDYEWSSYRANAEDQSPALVTAHEEYLRLGRDGAERRSVYRALFGAGPEIERFEAIRQATNGNFVLGDKPFSTKIAAALGRRVERGNAGRPPHRAEVSGAGDDLFSPPGKNVVCP